VAKAGAGVGTGPTGSERNGGYQSDATRGLRKLGHRSGSLIQQDRQRVISLIHDSKILRAGAAEIRRDHGHGIFSDRELLRGNRDPGSARVGREAAGAEASRKQRKSDGHAGRRRRR